ncbi:MAG: SDR family NAD(P)-dependent oxidoreductase [Hyphomicrobiales bacterium]|nr:SDR family NAD(P)-dependent oxidoreductase [Hyphomicrobiales bacterium]MCP5374072.1 SDR family NAD(P)-dependent oxidoreductase [Hyphomicrobiales bacterium]
MTAPATPAALVIGAGGGTGGAIARRFAAGGYAACVARRDGAALDALCAQIAATGGAAHSFPLDARDEDQVVDMFARVEAEVGPLEVCVVNLGGNLRQPIAEMEAATYERIWRTTCFAAFLAGREAARRMTPRGKGTIIFTGATASLRGGAGFAAFAGAKHAKRALAQSMARELGPQGIHVAHVVIDGIIDTEAVKVRRPDLYADRVGCDALLSPESIAEAYWQIHRQPRDAWTFETDLRPWAEPW